VRHCKWADEVIDQAPWVIDDEFLTQYRVDFVAHDAIPYISEGYDDVYGLVKRLGKFLETKRTEGISTSDLIMAIVKDYDTYVMRNLQRGYTKSQLNVGTTWEVRALAHEKKKKLDEQLKITKSQWEDFGEAAKAFVLEFNPLWLIQREKLENGKKQFIFSPDNYATHLKLVPEKTGGLIHHSMGLMLALTTTTLQMISYFNPLTYCRRSKYK